MDNKIHGIILKVAYDNMRPADSVEILGKSMLDWVSVAFSKSTYSVGQYEEGIALPILLKPYIDKDKDYTVALFSDTPLITQKTIKDAVSELENSSLNVLKMTRGYVFKTNFLLGAERIFTDNTHYFDEEDFITAFNYKQVALITEILKTRILSFHMENGVNIQDVSTCYIGCDVKIEKGAVIGANCVLRGNCVIKKNAQIMQNSVIENSIIDEGVKVNSSQIYKSFIGRNTTVGPYAYIRPESVIGQDCRIGDFVEIKKSVIGDGSKVSHLSYVGDCEMGKKCNIGCGVVFVNYDGKNKYKSVVGNGVFIGSNSNIISPVVLEDGAFVAAGSTINKSVPRKTLAIARARQENKNNWHNNQFFHEEDFLVKEDTKDTNFNDKDYTDIND